MIIAEFGDEVLGRYFSESTSSTHVPGVLRLDPNWFVAIANRTTIYSRLGIQVPAPLDVTILRNLENQFQFDYETEDANYINCLKLKQLKIDILIISNCDDKEVIEWLTDYLGYKFICDNLIIYESQRGINYYQGKYPIADPATCRDTPDVTRMIRSIINMIVADQQYGNN